MELKKKSRSKTLLWIAILSFVAVFLPVNVFGMDGMNGGFALSVGFGFISLVFFISAWVYARLDKEYNRIARGENVIARWQYTDEEWQAYTMLDYNQDKAGKKGLFYMIAGFCLFFGILFPILDHENGIYVTYVMLGLIAIIALTAWLSVRSQHHRNLNIKGEAIITQKSVILNGKLHTWAVLGNRLEQLKLVENTFPRVMEIEYSYPNRGQRGTATVRIPVPQGKEKEAEEVAMQIKSNK